MSFDSTASLTSTSASTAPDLSDTMSDSIEIFNFVHSERVRLLATPTFSEVWLCKNNGNFVVTKRTNVSGLLGPQALTQWKEGYWHDRFSYLPGVVPLLATYWEDGCEIVVTKFYQDGDLTGQLMQDRVLDKRLALSLLRSMLVITDTMHDQGLIYGDFSSENIVVTDVVVEDNVIIGATTGLLDFGLSAPVQKMPYNTGKLNSMAPETFDRRLVEDGKYATTSLDMYALGILFFVSLYGFIPFTHPSSESMSWNKARDTQEFKDAMYDASNKIKFFNKYGSCKLVEWYRKTSGYHSLRIFEPEVYILLDALLAIRPSSRIGAKGALVMVDLLLFKA